MLLSAILFIILLFPYFFLSLSKKYGKNFTLKIDVIIHVWHNNIVL